MTVKDESHRSGNTCGSGLDVGVTGDGWATEAFCANVPTFEPAARPQRRPAVPLTHLPSFYTQ